ncbi:phage tail tape measure protein [Acetoanaerobium sticklandii]|uniref:phage tail tape measure protein n=1 Tax=Acetoanaerobium sticklandii TaxID=1511 RepID=UPI003A8F1A24
MAEAKEVGIVLGAKDEYQSTLSRFKSDVLKTKSDTERAGNSITAQFSKITNAADKLNNKLGAVDKAIGRTFKAGLAGTAAYAAIVSNDLLQLDAGIAKINTLYDQTAQSQKVMTKDIIQTWKLIPQNFTQITQSMYDSISASLDPKNAASAARKFAIGAVAGGTDNISAVVKAVMGTKNAYAMDDSTLSEIMDVQFATIKAGIVEYEELSAALGTGLMPAAQASGIDFKAVYAGIAQLTKNNMPANVSATSLTQLFNKFTDKDGIKAFKKFGVDIQDASGHTRDLLDITKDLFNEFEKRGMTSEARKGFLKDLLGSDEAARAILPLVQNVKDFEKTYDTVVNKSKGMAKEAYIDQMDNKMTQLKIMMKSITGVGLDYAMQFDPLMDAIFEPFKKKILLEMDVADLNDAISKEKNQDFKNDLIKERDMMLKEIENIDLTPIYAWRDALTESVNNLKTLNPQLAAMADSIGNFMIGFFGEEGAETRDKVATGAKIVGGTYLSIKALTFAKRIGELFSWLTNTGKPKTSGLPDLGQSVATMMVNAAVVNINGSTTAGAIPGVPTSTVPKTGIPKTVGPATVGAGTSLLINAIGTAISLAIIAAIAKNGLDKNKEYLALSPEERTNQNIALMRKTKEDLKPRGHEKYPYNPAHSKLNVKDREVFYSSLQDAVHKMKITDMNINTTIPIELRSNPMVNVKFLLDGRSIPGIITTTTSNNFNTTRKEIERTERRMGGPTK